MRRVIPTRDKLDEMYAPDAATGCWLWLGTLTKFGYGRVWTGKGTVHWSAQRAMYEHLVGPVPTGLVLDHLCKNRACVNPAHLEPVTNQENVRRGDSPHALNGRRDMCVNGHPLVATTRPQKNRNRICPRCKLESQRERMKDPATRERARQQYRAYRERHRDDPQWIARRRISERKSELRKQARRRECRALCGV